MHLVKNARLVHRREGSPNKNDNLKLIPIAEQ